MATQKQTHFLTSLIRRVERGATSLPAEQQAPIAAALANLRSALAMCESGEMTNGDASTVIEQAKTLAEMFDIVAPATVAPKWRKIPGTDEWGIFGPADLITVGATVTVVNGRGDEQDVYIAGIVSTDDKGVLARKGRAPAIVIPAGVHVVPGVGLYRSEGRHYCDKFVPCHWAYCGNPKDVTLDSTTLVDARTARAVSWLMGNCCFCGLDLSNPASLVAGYGPTCAKKRGLPHGSVEVPDAAMVLAELLWLASLDVGVTDEYATRRAAQYSDRLADEA